MALETDPVTLDPYKAANTSGIQAFELTYESLTAHDETLRIQPSLAEKWDVSPNGLEYTFQLRPGVKWQDGKDFTAEDVKYWFAHLFDKATGSRWAIYFDSIDKVEALADRTVKLSLKAPSAGLLNYFATLRGSGMTQQGAAERTNIATAATGTGPYKLVEFVAKDHVRLARNASYWRQDRAYLDEIVMKVLPDMQTRVAALRTGQVHIAQLDKESADQLRGAQGVTVLTAPQANLNYVNINNSRKPFNDVRVRRALRMALDTDEMIQKAVSGAGRPAGAISPGFEDWGLRPEQFKYKKQDVATARALLAEAGQTNLKFTIVLNADVPAYLANAQIAQAAWKQIGVTADIQRIDAATFATRTQPPVFDYDMAFSGLSFQGDPDGYLYAWVHSKGNRNANGGYVNAKVDDLIVQGRATADPAKRHQIYWDVQQILEDDVPLFWLYEAQQFIGVRSNVRGFQPRFDSRLLSLAQTWLDG